MLPEGKTNKVKELEVSIIMNDPQFLMKKVNIKY